MPDLSILRDRRFAVLFTARTIAVLGSAFGPVALTFAVLDLPGATAGTLTLVLTAQTVPEIALMLFGGVIADRVPRHLLMTTAELTAALAFSVLAVLFLTGHAPLPVIVSCSAAVGVSIALYYPALTGLVPDVVPAERLHTANALLRFGTNAARLLGLSLAGGMVALVGSGWALATNAVGYTISALLLASLRLRRGPRRDGNPSITADLREGWTEFASRTWLWVTVLLFAVVIAAMQAGHGVLGPVVAREHLGGAAAWSTVLLGQSVGTLVGVVVSMRLRPRRPLLVAIPMVFALALPSLLLGFAAPLAVVVAGSFVLGVAFNTFGVLFETTMQREIPRESLSRVASYDALGSFMMGPLGLLAAAPLASAMGARPALLLCGAVTVAATACALLVPQIRRLTITPVTPAPEGADSADGQAGREPAVATAAS
ncbi:MFS transporter [Streptoalloteichus hindustanus]|uniref:Predicted arabinose efflux permease, MFS family n=1 Tax=Streptoalloteichus hindustanus TaxID=2017 RepID=A0A1M5CHP0_STRHI|nr:MFS transporter [Streptoalloteichus hindustanus]SHF54216.1 Predicted arabinose efflux permease, MFS family [Streptoalloteichus hindustanus]